MEASRGDVYARYRDRGDANRVCHTETFRNLRHRRRCNAQRFKRAKSSAKVSNFSVLETRLYNKNYELNYILK